MKDLEKSGTKIYWNQASDDKSVNVTVKEWMSENCHTENYFITDPDASFIKSGGKWDEEIEVWFTFTMNPVRYMLSNFIASFTSYGST